MSSVKKHFLAFGEKISDNRKYHVRSDAVLNDALITAIGYDRLLYMKPVHEVEIPRIVLHIALEVGLDVRRDPLPGEVLSRAVYAWSDPGAKKRLFRTIPITLYHIPSLQTMLFLFECSQKNVFFSTLPDRPFICVFLKRHILSATFRVLFEKRKNWSNRQIRECVRFHWWKVSLPGAYASLILVIMQG